MTPHDSRGEYAHVTIGEFEVRYRVMGEGPVLLCSELPLNPFAMFGPLQERLSANFRVFVIDLRGVVGHSDRRSQADDLLPFLSAFFLKLADALGINEFTLIGSFMFGAVSMDIARLAPNRVRNLILVSTLGILRLPITPLMYAITAFYRLPGIPLLFRIKLFRSLVEMTDYHLTGRVRMHELFHERRKIDLKLEDLYEQYKRPRSSHAALALMWAIRNLTYERLIPRLHEIRCPSLIIHGADDQWIPLRYVEQLHARVPNSRLVVIPHSRHAPELENPDLTYEHVAAFLGTQKLASS